VDTNSVDKSLMVQSNLIWEYWYEGLRGSPQIWERDIFCYSDSEWLSNWRPDSLAYVKFLWKTSFPGKCLSIMHAVVFGINKGEKFRWTQFIEASVYESLKHLC
jgi:hypothetical protein